MSQRREGQPKCDTPSPCSRSRRRRIMPPKSRLNSRAYCVGGSSMSDKTYAVAGEWKSRAYVDDVKYRAMYERSLKDPDGFWAEEAKRLHWYKAPTKIKNTSYAPDNVSIKWFEDGVTNVAYNCIDRHLPKRASQTAIIWEGDDPKDDKHVTYQ